jgi:hypothetical protein
MRQDGVTGFDAWRRLLREIDRLCDIIGLTSLDDND